MRVSLEQAHPPLLLHAFPLFFEPLILVLHKLPTTAPTWHMCNYVFTFYGLSLSSTFRSLTTLNFLGLQDQAFTTCTLKNRLHATQFIRLGDQWPECSLTLITLHWVLSRFFSYSITSGLYLMPKCSHFLICHTPVTDITSPATKNCCLQVLHPNIAKLHLPGCFLDLLEMWFAAR